MLARVIYLQRKFRVVQKNRKIRFLVLKLMFYKNLKFLTTFYKRKAKNPNFGGPSKNTN